jgi:hypothetical protein
MFWYLLYHILIGSSEPFHFLLSFVPGNWRSQQFSSDQSGQQFRRKLENSVVKPDDLFPAPEVPGKGTDMDLLVPEIMLQLRRQNLPV